MVAVVAVGGFIVVVVAVGGFIVITVSHLTSSCVVVEVGVEL